MLEHILEDAFLPAEYRRWKHAGGLFLLGECSALRPATQSSLETDRVFFGFAGLSITAFGQFLRSFAMISASSNFSHL